MVKELFDLYYLLRDIHSRNCMTSTVTLFGMGQCRGQGQGHTNFDCEYLIKGSKEQLLLLPSNRKSYICSLLPFT